MQIDLHFGEHAPGMEPSIELPDSKTAWRRDDRTCSAANVEQRSAAVCVSARTPDRARADEHAGRADARRNGGPGTLAAGIVDLFAGLGRVTRGFARTVFEECDHGLSERSPSESTSGRVAPAAG